MSAHRPEDHPYSGTNKRGARICHTCKRETMRQVNLRKKAKV